MIGPAVLLAARKREGDDVRGRAVERDEDGVEPPLRLHPLLVEPCPDEFAVRRDAGIADHLADPQRQHRRARRIETDIAVEIEPAVIGLIAEAVERLAGAADAVSPEKAPGDPADMVDDLGNRLRPQMRIERRIVDFTCKTRDRFVGAHQRSRNGLSNAAQSLMRSIWRRVPVFSNRRRR